MNPRYQAHPIAEDEDYELAPDSARRDIALTVAAALLLIVLASLADVRL